MQATLTLQAAPAARVQARRQQVACSAVAPQQRAVSVVAPKVGGITSQRNVAAHAKGAIKPMEATFTEFKLVDKSKKVRGRGRRAAAAGPAAAAALRLALSQAAPPNPIGAAAGLFHPLGRWASATECIFHRYKPQLLCVPSCRLPQLDALPHPPTRRPTGLP